MNLASDYIEKNRQTWDNKTAFHVSSSFYDMESFFNGKNTLKGIELNLLQNVSGKSILHLQCHFGQDSISLARMGASVTGVDFSGNSIEKAMELSSTTNTNTRFICCNIYDLPNYLDEKFDIVFTSYGTITWLPDLDRWAEIIDRFLKPGGRFVFAEFHPVIWMFDNDFEKIIYSYAKAAPIVEKESGTYADRNAAIETESITWNHSIAEVVNSLIKSGLEINALNEYDYSPYNCFNNAEEFEPGKFRIKHFGNKIPMVYSIGATKVIG